MNCVNNEPRIHCLHSFLVLFYVNCWYELAFRNAESRKRYVLKLGFDY